MKKKFLGLICLLYSFIISYVWFNGYLGNFIAPNMQIYIKSSIIPLIVIGLVLLLNNKINYNFKRSDIVLLIPLMFGFLAGNGNLSIDIAKVKATVKGDKQKIEETTIDNNIDMNKKIESFYFDIEDSNFSYIADYLPYTGGAKKLVGKTIRAKGIAVDYSEFFPKEYFMVGRYTITCCAADAEYTGFIVKKMNDKIEYGKWYEFEGYLEIGTDNEGYAIMVVNPTKIKKINGSKLNQYVYGCESYGQTACKNLAKYDLEY